MPDSFNGFEVRSCPDVPRASVRLVAIDGSTHLALLADRISHELRWQRFELSPGDYEALSRQIVLGGGTVTRTK